MKRAKLTLLLGAAVLAGCSARPVPVREQPPAGSVPPAAAQLPPATPQQAAPTADALRWRCEDGLQLHGRRVGDDLHLEGLAAGPVVLLRDAGGLTPQQSVYSSAQARLALGLGSDARDAVLQLLQPAPREVRCRQH